jgi:hypothetical protein
MLNNGRAVLVPGSGNLLNLPAPRSGDPLRLVVPSGSTLSVPGTIKITPPASR